MKIRLFILACTAGLVFPRAHGGDEAASDEERVAVIGGKIPSIDINDSLKASVNVYGYVSRSESGDWRMGEPLGAGGKIPLAYDLSYYKEDPFNKSYSYQRDLLPQYQDFSYLPLWQPNQLETRLHYRFFPRVWGTVSIDYNDALTRAESKGATQAPQVSELTLKYGPASVPGLSFTLGKMRLFGTFNPIFDQYPLENFRFSGIAADYRIFLARVGMLRFRLAMGGEFLGRTQALDGYIFSNGSNSQSLNYAFLDGIRERFHVLGTGHWTSPRGFSLGFLAGVQMLPRDSTFTTDQDIVNNSNPAYRAWPRSQGWQLGGEVGFRSRIWNHSLTFSHGRGDVAMGWSRPDAVQDTSLDTVSREQRFSRMGSSLSQATYWMSFQTRRIRVEAGAWWQDRLPSKKWAVNYTVDGNGVLDTFRLQAQKFRAAKVSLQPSMNVIGPLRVGLRFDHIEYLDPDAHSNTVEPLANSTLVRIPGRDPNEPMGPSRWDREAVNCSVISPYAELNLASGFQVRASWSGAWYDEPVWRQGTPDTFHANATVSAWLSYHFAQPQTGN